VLDIDDLLLDFGAWGYRSQRVWLTTRVPLNSGRERRNAERSRPRMMFKVPYDRVPDSMRAQLAGAFDACMGPVFNFRFRDKQDNQAVDIELGTAVGGGESMQLIKPYTFGPLSYERVIKFPADANKYNKAGGYHHDATPLALTEDTGGGPVALSGVSCDYSTGLVTFNATAGAVIRATFEFHVPVHFDDDVLDLVFTTYGHHSTDITLIEDFGA
jgi:uncharacterized protein (TIGR02217 family)